MTKPSMVIPTVHLNGTSKDALMDQAMAAIDASQKLLAALADMTPHGRDYYVHVDSYEGARLQHEHRVKRVHDVLEELQEVAAGIDRQG